MRQWNTSDAGRVERRFVYSVLHIPTGIETLFSTLDVAQKHAEGTKEKAHIYRLHEGGSRIFLIEFIDGATYL